MALRKRAQDNSARPMEQKGLDDREPILRGIVKVVPDTQSDEYHFYTAVILTLEENPIVSTTRKGTRSKFDDSEADNDLRELRRRVLEIASYAPEEIVMEYIVKTICEKKW